jgi:cytochrome b subunit of formate dehydrogenase
MSRVQNLLLHLKPWSKLAAMVGGLLLALVATPAGAAEEALADEDNMCIACHGNPDVWEKDTLRLFVKSSDLEGDIHWQKGMRCHDCHGGNATTTQVREAHAIEDGFRPIAKPLDEPAFCGHCHADANKMKQYHAQGTPKTDQVAKFWASTHGQHLKKFGEDKTVPNLTNCSSCHPKHAMRAATDPLSSVHPAQLTATCGKCHKNQQSGLVDGVHGKALVKDEQGQELPLSCLHCHGQNVHDMRPVKDGQSPVFVDHEVDGCGKCHEKDLDSYLASAHGRGLRKSGLATSAVCSSCHGAHAIYKAQDPKSLLSPTKVADTCGKCHRMIEDRLQKSVHGGLTGPGGAVKTAAPGGEIMRKPSCTDCHQRHDRPRADTTGFRLDISGSCGNCHTDLQRRYRLSLHGALSNLGYGSAANCSDCHGAHDILPVKDENSHLSLNNRIETCRKCHPRAVANLAGFDPHADHHDPDRSPLLHAVYLVLMTFLIGTFVVFGIHSILWLIRGLIDVLQHGRPTTFVPGAVAYVRFNVMHRVAHGLLLISFLGLAATGLPLKYSHMPWARQLADLLGGFDSTSVWHRIFGMINVICLVVYMIRLGNRLLRSPTGGATRQSVIFNPDSPVPNSRDFKDIVKMVKWFFGLGPKPTFERWAYWEKFDFWGAAADSVIIGLTGLILWFPNLFCLFLPGEAVNIAKVIHSTQALLATGFVFAIHFYSVWLRPEKFPMDMAMFTGVVSEHELREERPEYYQRLLEEGRLEKLRTVVPGRRALLLATLAGYLALSVGTALLVGMIAAAFTSH